MFPSASKIKNYVRIQNFSISIFGVLTFLRGSTENPHHSKGKQECLFCFA